MNGQTIDDINIARKIVSNKAKKLYEIGNYQLKSKIAIIFKKKKLFRANQNM